MAGKCLLRYPDKLSYKLRPQIDEQVYLSSFTSSGFSAKRHIFRSKLQLKQLAALHTYPAAACREVYLYMMSDTSAQCRI